MKFGQQLLQNLFHFLISSGILWKIRQRTGRTVPLSCRAAENDWYALLELAGRRSADPISKRISPSLTFIVRSNPRSRDQFVLRSPIVSATVSLPRLRRELTLWFVQAKPFHIRMLVCWAGKRQKRRYWCRPQAACSPKARGSHGTSSSLICVRS